MNKSITPPGTVEDTTEPLVPIPGIRVQIKVAGQSVNVTGETSVGGYIVNPLTAEEQGLSEAHDLFVDVTGPAGTAESLTTVAIKPGSYYVLPRNIHTGVWVNSLASEHRFTAVQIIPTTALPEKQSELDKEYKKGKFPPKGPTGLLHTIPSYLYQEYTIDPDLPAFVHTYNSMMQDIVDTFNNLSLPIYTRDPISGALLDWVAEGVWGIKRTNLSSGKYDTIGPYNTWQYNTWEYNAFEQISDAPIIVTTDDIFRRIMTWHISKQNCKYFSIAWLKKRVMQFLIGENGILQNIDQHYQVSVTFGLNNEVTIRFILGKRDIIGGAIYNDNSFKYNTMMYNELDTTYTAYEALPNMDIFADAVACGALEFPFQYKFNVVIG